jgi:hypothetical protein
VVINAQTGLVYGHKYHGVIFKLPSGHKHRAGDCIKFKAVRTVDLVSGF